MKNYYSVNTLIKRRGWTISLIKKLLGNCDKEGINPHDKSKKTYLYKKDRVEKAETTIDYIKVKLQKKNRSTKALKAVDTRKRNVLAKFDALEINVEIEFMKKHDLIRFAIDENNSTSRNMKIDYPPTDLSDNMVQVVVREFILLYLTNYPDVVEEFKGKIGSRGIKAKLRDVFYDAMNEVYPYLT